jgi:isocitrate dehydrogenase kinase/phosphatase
MRTESSPASTIARLILDGFEAYRLQFNHITQGAMARFEGADWQATQLAATQRIKLYNIAARMTLESLGELIDPLRMSLADWSSIKEAYAGLIRGRPDSDLAETVFNTVFRRTWRGQHLHDEVAFVQVSESDPPRPQFAPQLTRSYGPASDLGGLLRRVLDDAGFRIPWLNQAECLQQMVAALQTSIPLLRRPQALRLEMLKPIFYRNKGAYLIGKLQVDEHLFPLAIPIHNIQQSDGAPSGLYVDALIWTDSELSMIFSFTRAYFMLDTSYPNELVSFLQELLPNKKRWELYTAIGYYKHGKTEFYRGFLHHLEHSADQFVVAQGIKGLVMTVFTLESYDVVFKIIRDKFSPTKSVTREQVKEAYYLVKTHDRVGRMADTQEFSNFIFPRERFSAALLAELVKVAASSVTLTDEHVIVSHLYTERRMTPLNIYLKDKSEFELRQVLDEYGNAIKQLAAANIFPGDMLLKNFGVTRHGRVVFYDYDEICYLTDVVFRRIPPPRYPEDLLASEPWYEVGSNDVFPEEFKNFLFSAGHLQDIFCEFHADLFTPEYWEELQHNIRQKQVLDVYPYRRARRFHRGSLKVSQANADSGLDNSEFNEKGLTEKELTRKD